jgi:hypothetical protein
MKFSNQRFARGAGVLLAGSAFALCAVARAGTALFDLEDQAVSSPTSLTSLTLTQGGETMTITRDGGAAFGIADLSSFSGTVAFGARSLVPDSASTAPFIANFSPPVSSVSVMMGHFGSDTATIGVDGFDASDATGTSLGNVTDTLPGIDANTFTLKSVELDHANIVSARFVGGVNGDNSVYYDNIGVATGATGTTAVPLPSAALAFPLGAVVAGLAMRRFRRAALRNVA